MRESDGSGFSKPAHRSKADHKFLHDSAYFPMSCNDIAANRQEFSCNERLLDFSAYGNIRFAYLSASS